MKNKITLFFLMLLPFCAIGQDGNGVYEEEKPYPLQILPVGEYRAWKVVSGELYHPTDIILDIESDGYIWWVRFGDIVAPVMWDTDEGFHCVYFFQDERYMELIFFNSFVFMMVDIGTMSYYTLKKIGKNE